MIPTTGSEAVKGLMLTLFLGLMGAILARWIGAPMPFLLGSLAGTAAAGISGFSLGGIRPSIPLGFRNIFVAVIGVMIGSAFTPSLVSDLGSVWIAALFVVLFVISAFAANLLVFTFIGKYDRNTAFFASMPGGLIENISFGEQLGADIQILTLQQFSRIMLVITLLPFIFLIWTGENVGSAAGVSLHQPGLDLATSDIAWLTVAGFAGLFGGRALKLPAAIMTGPLIASAAVHLTGLTDASPAGWMVSVAQVVVGASLGARFVGFRPELLFKTFGLSVLSVLLMLLLDAIIVLVLMPLMDMPFNVLFISFAPGGVTETALIALSLDANPVFVATMHVFRIGVTVVISSIAFRYLKGRVK